MTKTALILGITGGYGEAMAQALSDAGWSLTALHRDPARAKKLVKLDGVTWITGDAMTGSDVINAAAGASIIVHAVNPPGYRDWGKLAAPMLSHSIEAARRSGARIVLPGNVYNFHPDSGEAINEAHPQMPTTSKGKIRVSMELMLQDAARDGVKSLIVRAGDFFGGKGTGSWLNQAMVKPGKPATSVTYPGKPKIGHAFAYLPDFARTTVRIIEHEPKLATFEVFHFKGHYVEEGIGFAEVIAELIDVKRVSTFPWIALQLMAPFNQTFRGLLEMRYLWEKPIGMDNAKLIRLIGAEVHTPLPVALETALDSLGCLPRLQVHSPSGQNMQTA
jgi:nucleoside-diphosphate-sugar epimerase